MSFSQTQVKNRTVTRAVCHWWRCSCPTGTKQTQNILAVGHIALGQQDKWTYLTMGQGDLHKASHMTERNLRTVLEYLQVQSIHLILTDRKKNKVHTPFIWQKSNSPLHHWVAESYQIFNKLFLSTMLQNKLTMPSGLTWEKLTILHAPSTTVRMLQRKTEKGASLMSIPSRVHWHASFAGRTADLQTVLGWLMQMPGTGQKKHTHKHIYTQLDNTQM